MSGEAVAAPPRDATPATPREPATAPSPERRASALLARPVRREGDEVRWETEAGRAVVVYPKHFGRFEGWLHRRIGGPTEVRRPMDRFTTFIWERCDGAHTVADIVRELDGEFGEAVAPAAERVQGFLERLLYLNLVILEDPEEACA